MAKGIEVQKKAVASGHWPLFRYNPRLEAEGKNPFVLDSQEPSMSYADFAYTENRFKSLDRSNHEAAAELMKEAQAAVDRRWRYLKHLSKWSPSEA
jgi:pyruvate-ferredoxin/flavodoxin oxidoreductase